MVQMNELFLGARVRLPQEMRSRRVGGYQGYITIPEDSRGVVTRMNSETVWVSFEVANYHRAVSVSVYPDQLVLDSGGPGGPPRAYGTKPEDTEDMTYIGIDHPGIQWLWDDLARFAAKKSWCAQYDELALQVGIPGRKRAFTAHASLGDIQVQSTIQARSQQEADDLLAESIYNAANHE